MKRSEIKRKTWMKRSRFRRPVETPRPGKRKPRRRTIRGRSKAAKAYFNRHSHCELCGVLGGAAYRHFKSLQPSSMLREFDVHHVWTPTRWEDGDANFITACKVCHSFIHDCWGRYGRLACFAAKIRNGTFDREIVTRRWRKDPVAVVAVELATGVYESEPAIADLATWIVLKFRPEWLP